jgi:hypothetical protein
LFRLHLGDPLNEVRGALIKVRGLSVGYQQVKVKAIASCALQFCNNLQGLAKDPLTLSGAFFDEHEVLEQLKKDGMNTLVSIALHMKYRTAVLLNEYHFADLIFRENETFFENTVMPIITISHSFLRGLVALALAREFSGRARHQKMAEAKRIFKKLSSLLIHCPDNIINKLHLLEAELEFCRGRYSAALLKYEKSIFYAERVGFISEHAIACEKAALMLRSGGRCSEANVYLRKAQSLYQGWGAQVKVDQIDRLLGQ